MAKEKKEKPKKNLEFLKYLETEDEMHDDHGPVIIGPRDKKPKIFEEGNGKKKK